MGKCGMQNEDLISAEAIQADQLAEQATQEGDFDRAIEIYKDALNEARINEDVASAGFLFRLMMATTAHKEIIKHNYDSAIRVYEIAIGTAVRLQDKKSAGFFFRELVDTRAELHLWHRRFSSAKEVYRKGMSDAERMGDAESIAYCQWQMTNLYIEFPSMTTGNHAVSLINKTISMYDTQLGDHHKTMQVAADMCSTCAHAGNEQGIKVCSDTVEQIKKRIEASPALHAAPEQPTLERPRLKIANRTPMSPPTPQRESGSGMHIGEDVRKRRDR